MSETLDTKETWNAYSTYNPRRGKWNLVVRATSEKETIWHVLVDMDFTNSWARTEYFENWKREFKEWARYIEDSKERAKEQEFDITVEL